MALVGVATRMVRQVSPLPPGRYWLFVLGQQNVNDFGDWVKDMAGAVRVETVQEFGPRDSRRTLFVIFNVPPGRAPFLDAQKFGFPNEAPPSVTSMDDVQQSPTVEPPSLEDFGRGAGSFFGGAAQGLGFSGLGAIVLLVLVASMMQQQPQQRRRAAA